MFIITIQKQCKAHQTTKRYVLHFRYIWKTSCQQDQSGNQSVPICDITWHSVPSCRITTKYRSSHHFPCCPACHCCIIAFFVGPNLTPTSSWVLNPFILTNINTTSHVHDILFLNSSRRDYVHASSLQINLVEYRLHFNPSNCSK